MNRVVVVKAVVVVLCSMATTGVVTAQSGAEQFRAGAQVVGSTSAEFDSTDIGVSGLFSWHPTDLFGFEAEIGMFPTDFPDDPAFSRSRVEGLFGVTVGPRIGRVRPFAKVRPGFVRFNEAPEPFACILIFPPPLACSLAGGANVFALDLGGGVEVMPAGRTYFRVDVGDRVVRYQGPVFDGDNRVRDEAFFSHDFRFSIGAGVRF